MSSLNRSAIRASFASAPSADTTAPATTRPNRPRRSADDPPSIMSVKFPAAHTPGSTEGLSLDAPLLARVTCRTL
jgi:hypothetical protein